MEFAIENLYYLSLLTDVPESGQLVGAVLLTADGVPLSFHHGSPLPLDGPGHDLAIVSEILRELSSADPDTEFAELYTETVRQFSTTLSLGRRTVFEAGSRTEAQTKVRARLAGDLSALEGARRNSNVSTASARRDDASCM